MIDTVTTTVDDYGNGPVTEYRIPPNGRTHDLQKKITQLLHRVIMNDGRVTLANLGYLGINTLMYNKNTGEIRLRIYFDSHYACRVITNSANNQRRVVPVEPLLAFENYLFVGNIEDVITYEKVLAPRSKVKADEVGMSTMVVKDQGKLTETNAMVLNCNLAITMAAAFDIPLDDPAFKVRCDTVGKPGKNAAKSIVTTAYSDEVPLSVIVRCSPDKDESEGYDPDMAVPYLVALNEKTANAARNQEKLKRDVKKKAKKNGAKADKKQNASFNKYT